MINILRQHGIRAQAAAEWAETQYLLEALTDFTMRGIMHLRRLGEPPAWFDSAHTFPPGIQHVIHGFKLWKLAYGGKMQRAPSRYDEEKRALLCARALRLAKPPNTEAFESIREIFWSLQVLLTDDGSVDLFGKRGHLGVYDGRHGYGILAVPAYRGPQNFGARLDAEGDDTYSSFYMSHQTLLHELRHAFQDYHNTTEYQQGQFDRAGEPEGVEETERRRHYQLRSSEVDARITEFTRALTAKVSSALSGLWVSHKNEELNEHFGGVKPHLDRRNDPRFPENVKRVLLQHYQDNKREMAQVFSSFAFFRDYALHLLQRRYDELYTFAYADIADAKSERARDLIETRIRQVYDSFTTKYRNLIPRQREAA